MRRQEQSTRNGGGLGSPLRKLQGNCCRCKREQERRARATDGARQRDREYGMRRGARATHGRGSERQTKGGEEQRGSGSVEHVEGRERRGSEEAGRKGA